MFNNVVFKLVELSDNANSLHYTPTCIEGGKIKDIDVQIDNTSKLIPYKDVVVDNQKFKEYLINNGDEITNLKEFLDNMEAATIINELLDSKEEMPEKVSTYKNAIKYLVEFFPITRNFDCDTLRFFVDIEGNKTTTFYKPIMEMLSKTLPKGLEGLKEIYETQGMKAITNIATIKRFKIDDKAITIFNSEYETLIRLATRYTVVKMSDVKNCNNPKRVAHILTRFNFFKAKHYENEGYRTTAMKFVWEMAIRTSFDTKMLQGFYNHVTEDFFHNNPTFLKYACVANGDKYTEMVEDITNTNLLNLIEYALANRKFAFLDMIKENVKEFVEIVNNNYTNNSTLLFNDKVWHLINLNEVNKKNAIKMIEQKLERNVRLLDEDTKLTPNELLCLNDADEDSGLGYLYPYLDCKIDAKILIMRQLKGIEYTFKNDDATKRIAVKLSEKNLSNRLNSLGYECEKESLLKALSLDERFESLVNAAKNQVELDFIYRNRDTINTSVSLVENLESFLTTDKDCARLFELLNLSKEFKERYQSSIRDFCIKGNASIVVTYHDEGLGYRATNQRESILKIAKAAMSGKMKEFKFYALEKEIERTLPDGVKNIWIENGTLDNGSLHLWESYSFEDTMNIGVKPNQTCMNYRSGGYNECLLANFDSNKKVLYVKDGNVTIGRAIIRLTKSLNKDEATTDNSVVSFLDVEKEGNNTSGDFVDVNGKEELTIFLERPYFGHCDSVTSQKVRKMFCQYVMDKVGKMNARFLASDDYYDCDLTETSMRVFISHTKNGVQYMDSFGGTNHRGDEASYNSCTCYKSRTI